MNASVKSAKAAGMRVGMKQRLGFNFFDVFVYGFCILFALICFYPLWYVLVVSVMPYDVYIHTNLVLLPSSPLDFQYYKAIFTSSIFKDSIFISFLITFLRTFLTVVVSATMAYGVSKTNIKGMKLLNVLAVFTMFFGGGLIPTYFLYMDLGLLKTFWVQIIPFGFNVGQYVIMRNYFSYSVPQELEEAARIDGANDFRIFFRIVLPLSKPMLAACSLFIAVAAWNDYSTYLMYCGKTEYQPFVWVLRRLLTEATLADSIGSGPAGGAVNVPRIPAISLRMATIICAMLPIMAVYPFLQKYFAKGILIGAVKE